MLVGDSSDACQKNEKYIQFLFHSFLQHILMSSPPYEARPHPIIHVQLRRAFFRRQIINPTTAATSITGSANMNTGICPAVSVTIVEHRRIRLIPELRTTRPVLSRSAFLEISQKSKQTAALAAGYSGSMLRAIVPPALP